MTKMAGCRVDLGESHFISLNQAFINDPDIDEVDMIPCLQCQEEQEKDDDPIVVVHHKLGIKSWCVRHLYLFAYKNLFKGNKDLALTVTDSIQLTRAVLIFNAECCTAWNNRKELTSKGLLSLDDDLKFSSLVISKYPRSAETFAHRRWIITQILRHKGEEFFRQGLLRTELVTTLHAAECYADNYTAWSHRGWLVERFMSDRRKKLFCELQMMGKWTEMHISDNCGFHYRQVLIKLLQNICSKSEIVQLLLEELKFTKDLILMFPGHEVIWYHRRFLFYYWNQWFSDLSTINLLELASSRNRGIESSNSLTHGLNIDPWRTNQSSIPSLAELTGSSYQLLQIPNSTPFASNSLTVDQVEDKSSPLSTTSELTFCDAVMTECSIHEREVQRRCAANYKRWIMLSNSSKACLVNNSKITVTSKAGCSS